ncbi:hypothetical protein NEUTE2DRAFT_64397 [Neurospora tetrasperma FGSC 2509]|nr:hypothetical protein NEUTE2DRAFT_64397 [Neurospora tetrasperma FGSC 2509]
MYRGIGNDVWVPGTGIADRAPSHGDRNDQSRDFPNRQRVYDAQNLQNPTAAKSLSSSALASIATSPRGQHRISSRSDVTYLGHSKELHPRRAQRIYFCGYAQSGKPASPSLRFRPPLFLYHSGHSDPNIFRHHSVAQRPNGMQDRARKKMINKFAIWEKGAELNAITSGRDASREDSTCAERSERIPKPYRFARCFIEYPSGAPGLRDQMAFSPNQDFKIQLNEWDHSTIKAHQGD